MPLITELYAFITTEEPGEEGVPAIQLGTMMYPLFGADTTRMEDLRRMAQGLSNATGMKMTLAKFSVREDLDTITPQGGTA